MKLIYATGITVLAALFSGCAMFKAAKFIKGGSVAQPAFKVEVPFELRYGLIVLKVTIHGKEHNFVLDSGAPNVISKELAQQLCVKLVGKDSTRDAHGNKGSLEYAIIDSIGIGGLQFLNTGAATADLRQSPEISCFNVDGFIGANLMRKAVWQFDYERHIMTIASSRDSLTIPAGAKTIRFRTAHSGTPLIDVQMNGQTDHNVAVDLGSNLDFISTAETFDLLMGNSLVPNTWSYGYGATALYGRGEQDTTRYAVIRSMQMGDVTISNQVVSFPKKGVKTVGTHFFRNYKLVLDWQANELTMISVRPFDNLSEQKYNCSFVLRDHQVFVGSINAAGAVADGPQLGDQVLEIDGRDYSNCSSDVWCTLMGQRLDGTATNTNVRVKHGDKELNFTLTKEVLFHGDMLIHLQ